MVFGNPGAKMFVTELKCLKCGNKHRAIKGLYICEKCGGKLDIIYDYEKIASKIDKKELTRRPGGVWRYFELLPVSHKKNIVTLEEGNTPLLEAKNIAHELGMKHLFLKDETRNPTMSFKDRPMSVGVSKAVEFGAQTVVCASSGNAAVALSAYSAKAGIKCYTFVAKEAPLSKIAQISMHGAIVVRPELDGTGDPTYNLMIKSWKKFGWHPIPSGGVFNPYQPEGSKTISYEICEQLNWRAPDWLIVPVGAGTLLSGNAKGYFEFERLGFIKELPHLAAIQPEGSAPLVKAFKEGTKPYEIQCWPEPNTCAGGCVDPYPWDADTAIPALKRTKGTAETVTEAEIIETQKSLAKKEGIFAEPSGSVGFAGLRKLLEAGIIDRSDVVVVEVTGGGLKDIEIAMRNAHKPELIEPELKKLKKIIEKK